MFQREIFLIHTIDFWVWYQGNAGFIKGTGCGCFFLYSERVCIWLASLTTLVFSRTHWETHRDLVSYLWAGFFVEEDFKVI